VLSVPELGVIPSADFEKNGGASDGLRGKWKRMRGPALPRSEAANETQMLTLAGWQAGPSLLTESFRLTMTSLMLMFREHCPRVLAVTSPGPGEGKTTVCGHLAMAMAEAGRNVLLIDLDLRRPHLHTLFNLTNEFGFSDLIKRDDPAIRVTAAHPAIRCTKFSRISVLPSGQVEMSAIGELFHSPRAAGILRQLRECYDAVIVDTPPMLQFSESRMVASLADGVLLVLRSGVTDKESAMAARMQLLQDHAELLGTILNDWNPRQSRGTATYASYYRSYMRYHSSSKDEA
jgi:capsular exopolysaccharide synthesis family protein